MHEARPEKEFTPHRNENIYVLTDNICNPTLGDYLQTSISGTSTYSPRERICALTHLRTNPREHSRTLPMELLPTARLAGDHLSCHQICTASGFLLSETWGNL